MRRLFALGAAILAACTAHADTITNYDLFLQHIISTFDLRPLPTKPFEETEKYKLGRALFFDPILSGNRDISCATCHLIERGLSDALSASIGTGGVGLAENRSLPSDRPVQPRNAIDLWNRDNNRVKVMFWDGRIEVTDPVQRIFRSPLGARLPIGLENLMAVQALFPLAQEDEMLGAPGDRSPAALPVPHANQPNELATQTADLTGPARIEAVLNLLMKRIIGEKDSSLEEWQLAYRQLFQAAYPTLDVDNISIVQLANALSHFEEIAFATRHAPWDMYLTGDNGAIDNTAKRGAFLFFGRARCVVCHEGPLFSDFEFHSIGVKDFGPSYDSAGGDTGRFGVTGRPDDKHQFRTPPLRNVTLTAPYFHNGNAMTLEDAIRQHVDPLRYADKYEESGHLAMNMEQIEAISPILMKKPNLDSTDIDDLVGFLQTLEDPGISNIDRIVPKIVPSGLLVSVINPALSR